MPNIIDTLDQEVMWYAQDGFPVPLDTMDPEHMTNLYRYLLRNAERLYMHKLWKEAKDQGDASLILWGSQLPQDPEEWVRNTPFFRALERRIRNHGSINPDSLTIEGASHGQGQGRGQAGEERRQVRQVFYLGSGQSGT